MNTDNTAISGETIDYGPCAFMDDYHPRHGVQLDRPDGPLRLPATSPTSRMWNLAQLASACCR